MLTKAWLFPGQGSQYPQMGRHIWPEKLASAVLSMAETTSGLPLRDVMQHGPDAKLRSPEYLEPSIFALQASYVLSLQSKGIQPDAVAGYSLGELGALYCAGCLSLLDALTVASARGKILARNCRMGDWSTSALSFASEPSALPLDSAENIFIAAYNSPQDITVTGESIHIQKLQKVLRRARVAFSPVAIAGPWHSPLAAISARETANLLSSVEFRKPMLPVCLGTSGRFETDIESIRASLSRQLESPVQWTRALESLWQVGVRSTLEIGPGRVLTSFLRNNWTQRNYSSQFLERQGGRAINFAEIWASQVSAPQPINEQENSWTS